ncbi:MAG: preprotein translocase subunit SecG [Bacteroidota bacterium]
MSGIAFFIAGFVCVLVAAALIFVVVIQNSKGGGLSSTFGASSAGQIMGARRSTEFVEKLTWGLAIGLAAVAFFANIVGKAGTGEPTGSEVARSLDKAYQVAPTAVPSVEDLGGLQEADPNTGSLGNMPEGDGQ